MGKYELLEWRDKRYQHVKYMRGSKAEAKEAQDRLNEGYTGPRYIIREVPGQFGGAKCPTTR